MPSRFIKSRDNFCDFTVRARGVGDYPNHIIEVHNSWHEEFGQRLMNELPRGAWMYDRDASPRVFRILYAVNFMAVQLARQCFANVYWTEGERIDNLKTREVHQQQSLF
jgi:hypothetical protein